MKRWWLRRRMYQEGLATPTRPACRMMMMIMTIVCCDHISSFSLHRSYRPHVHWACLPPLPPLHPASASALEFSRQKCEGADVLLRLRCEHAIDVATCIAVSYPTLSSLQALPPLLTRYRSTSGYFNYIFALVASAPPDVVHVVSWSIPVV